MQAAWPLASSEAGGEPSAGRAPCHPFGGRSPGPRGPTGRQRRRTPETAPLSSALPCNFLFSSLSVSLLLSLSLSACVSVFPLPLPLLYLPSVLCLRRCKDVSTWDLKPAPSDPTWKCIRNCLSQNDDPIFCPKHL